MQRHAVTSALQVVLWLVLACTLAAPACGATVAMTTEVAAGKLKTARIPNLPKDAVVALAVEASGKVLVLLLNEQDARRFPKVSEPLFAGALDRRLSFTVTIPATGTYYLVFDNRRGGEAQKLKFVIKAVRGRAQQQPGTPSPSLPGPTLLPPEGKPLDKL